jgi:hypothetical protein
MVVGLLQVEVYAPNAQSLKDKAGGAEEPQGPIAVTQWLRSTRLVALIRVEEEYW